jgi:four helix bundle protein
LEIWKNARVLHTKIREIGNNTLLSKDYGLKDQVNRSSGSVMDNIWPVK